MMDVTAACYVQISAKWLASTVAASCPDFTTEDQLHWHSLDLSPLGYHVWEVTWKVYHKLQSLIQTKLSSISFRKCCKMNWSVTWSMIMLKELQNHQRYAEHFRQFKTANIWQFVHYFILQE